jgi:hypothetical protein
MRVRRRVRLQGRERARVAQQRVIDTFGDLQPIAREFVTGQIATNTLKHGAHGGRRGERRARNPARHAGDRPLPCWVP